MKRNRRILVGLFTAATLFSLSSFFSPRNVEIGQKAPLTELKMTGINGDEHTLESLKKDKGLLVVFSCNTCPFVVGSKSFPGWERQYNELAAFAGRYEIGMVLINSNEAKRSDDDALDMMREHAEERGYEMPYLVDENSELANAFGAKTTPHVYFLDENLQVQYMGAIDNTWDPTRKQDITYLKDAIQDWSKTQQVKTPSTDPKGCSIKRKA